MIRPSAPATAPYRIRVPFLVAAVSGTTTSLVVMNWLAGTPVSTWRVTNSLRTRASTSRTVSSVAPWVRPSATTLM